MSTTLTREALLAKKLRTETVPIEGWGDVLLQERTSILASMRESQMFNDRGKMIQSEFDARDFWKIIDQVMNPDGTPMFKKEDFEALKALPPSATRPLIHALHEFNGDYEKKSDPQSNDSAESSEETKD